MLHKKNVFYIVRPFILFLLSIGYLNAGPKIVFSNKVADFGELVEGDTAVCLFHFTNQGDSVLEIIDVTATCGCTVADIDSYLIKPGGEGTIKTIFHSTGRRGKITKFVHVLTNDKKNRFIRLKITGFVKRTWSVEPKKVDFGEIKPGGIFIDTVSVTSTAVDSIKVDSIKTEPEELKARLIATKANRVTIEVTYNSEGLRWRFIGVVRIYTNIPHGWRIQFPVYARIKQKHKKNITTE